MYSHCCNEFSFPRNVIFLVIVQRHINPAKEQTWTETEKIHVCVRKRPLGVREVRRGEVDVAKVEEGKSVLVCENKEAVDLTHYLQQVGFQKILLTFFSTLNIDDHTYSKCILSII